MVKEFIAHLKEAITEEVQGTGWRYQRFKICRASGGGTFRLEVCDRHSSGLFLLGSC
jgi:hypothetical protein